MSEQADVGKVKGRESIPRVDVLGVGVSVVNMASALDEISRWVEDRERHYVCVTGVHGVMESQADADLKRIHNMSGLTVPDGMPLVWAGRFAAARGIGRVAGMDMMPQLIAVARDRGWRNYFYGGAPGVADALAARWMRDYPGLEVAGTYSPPFRELTAEEDREVVDRINHSNPDLVWVGLSTPKQERWMGAHVNRVDASVMLGVGAAFDFHIGRVKRAPIWMQKTGLEWSYRLFQEPRRLWRRYLSNNPRFLWQVAMNPPRLIDADHR